MNRTGQNSGAGSVRGAFLFALLAGFAILSLLVVLVGAKVYTRIDATGTRNYESRTALSYLAGKVRAADAADAVAVQNENGLSALLLYAEYDGERYVTYLYVYEGRLREYFTRADATFRPSVGEAVAEAVGFDAAISDGLLTLRLTLPDGSDESIRLYLQSGEASA